MKAWLLQCKFEMLRNLRNRRFFFFSILLPVGFYFLYVHLVGKAVVIDGVNWPTYYMISMATFGVVGTGLNGLSSRVAYERTQGWVKLMQTTPQRASNYITTKIAANVLLNICEVAILFVAGAAVEHVTMGVGEWMLAAITTILGGLVFIALGILVGHLAGSDASQIVASILYFLMSITGGLWMPVSTMPSVMRHIANFMPTYHLAHIAWNVLAGKGIAVTDIWVLLVYLVVFTGLAVYLANRRSDARVA
ncbi:ABC-2 type transport system permease protein [Alicyclobacillus sacchari]|uniref:ABC-2 type transport system permease protein n=1 Tax=Alicyclobacillus sacchari TaxID=392010 RepID=A0A4R8LKA4_9BACL|nr:ABC transporter permease [Alicyclobacillus sacchari]TDY44585.1 ABC-2 type transport system permease protein [Alicyclobacillus sacchari]GMA57938.1 ABC transporter permease [Alicyclobacillus sacchari]